MSKIQLMDENLSNKIAAGEVVERPASVVKELLENAIDAGSTRVDIEVEEAGLSKIRIVDNGAGIEKEDVLLAFERHATSKIKDEHDLFRIRTLGFRGEALPSIASVSSVDMKTCTGDGPGTHLVIRGGTVDKHESSAGRKGTDITVTDLFYNTPARLKYMKTIHTELGNISDVVNRIAFSHPEVALKLTHNGKKMLQTTGNGDLLQVVAGVYGISVAKKMVKIESSSLDFRISGYIALPEVTRASRNYISTLINGRFIKNYPLVKAIQSGYHTLLPIGRYPIVLLHIEMDPLLVDVNVHPAKLEVRLSKEKELNELVESAIKDVMKDQQLIPDVQASRKYKEKVNEEQQHFTFEHRDQSGKTERYRNEAGETAGSEADENPYRNEPDILEMATEILNGNSGRLSSDTLHVSLNETEKTQTVHEGSGATSMDEDTKKEPSSTFSRSGQEKSRVPVMYPIGQMHGTYILAQNEKGLYIIDQHAAQERINYEFFRERVGEITDEVQEMLVPLTFEFTRAEALKINEYSDSLKEVGVFLEPFGPQGYIVRSHPSWFPSGHEQETIEDMISQLLHMNKVDVKKLREEAAIMMSCKRAIKANRHLRDDEIFALLETLRKSSDPFTCPHGRPIIIHYSTYEMEKMFKRVM
ncbi:DNA mismatch repair endonuclease MutL [Bacillus marinisedimentorum]|uniref:DNA mismatch repair endonuclease MutL n=1 Tax=Bacillus marinisedimentorum TaxID=1821260 RepID=UPI0007E26012|nr:DNA mismatch repair endonuclease MutL [Bacillus marinisedimentorum]